MQSCLLWWLFEENRAQSYRLRASTAAISGGRIIYGDGLAALFNHCLERLFTLLWLLLKILVALLRKLLPFLHCEKAAGLISTVRFKLMMMIVVVVRYFGRA